MNTDIPEVVILRLPLYARVLSILVTEGIQVASSHTLANLLQSTPAQIRKDLSYFGRFGKQGRGYNVAFLYHELGQILGLDIDWNIAVIGVGQLGTAIINYGGFVSQGFHIVAAFDTDVEKQGTYIGGLGIRALNQMEDVVKELKVDLGIVAVPPSQGQEVVDRLVKSGVKGILNYAPFQARVPKGVWVRDVDPVVSLESITYHLKFGKHAKRAERTRQEPFKREGKGRATRDKVS